jgi:colanic acid/amylovoran biosynthesis glycosyltransferase
VPESRRLVCVARLSPEKGVFVLLRAAEILARQDLRFELSLLGDGPDRPELEREVERRGLVTCVRFEGWASRDTVAERIRASRALVLPSFGEGLPVVIMEALAMRRPVIATRVNGVPELVAHGLCGWLVTPGSEVELADAMRDALTRPTAELDAMGSRGAERVATMHNPDAQVRAIAQLLRDGNPSARETARDMQ